MKLSINQQKKVPYLLLAFLVPVVGMLGVMLFSGHYPFGTSSMLYSDKYHQYYPFFLEFRRVLLSGDSLLHSWNVGMGMDYLGLISYYLASPFYLLSVLIPESWMLGYFHFLTPIKLGLAGLFFAIFLKKIFKKEDLSIVLFGGFYALCAWSLGYHWNIMWLDTFALLPLVMLGMVSLLERRKFVLYTFCLFLSVFSNYYVGFFICIFVFLSFFCYEICRWKSWGRFLRDLGWIAGFSVLAIAMTLILELPALASLQTTQSSVNQFPKGFVMNIAKENTFMGLLDAMRQVAGNMSGGLAPSFKEGLPNLYCGIITTIFAFLFLTSPEVKLRDKLCSVFLLLFFMFSFILRQLDYIWHGFHFTNMIPYRFSFLFSFVMLYMAYRAWLIRDSFQPWKIAAAGIFGLLILLCCKDTELVYKLFSGNIQLLPWEQQGALLKNLQTIASHIATFAYNLIFLILYMAVLLFRSIQIKREIAVANAAAEALLAEAENADTLPELIPEPVYEDDPEEEEEKPLRIHAGLVLSILFAAELLLNVVNFGMCYSGTSISNYPKGTADSAIVMDHMRKLEENTLFYRAEVTHSQTLNDGALNNYNGISTFTSSANVRVTLFMQSLGYGAKNTYNRYCFEESSPVANLFLNLKYMIERDGNVPENHYFTSVYQHGKVHLLENNRYLPLGFLANTDLKDTRFSIQANAFVFQNQLLRDAAGIQADVWKMLVGHNLDITSEDVHIKSTTATGYCAYDAEDGGTISYTFTPSEEGFVCIHLKLPKKNRIKVYKNDEFLYSETYSLPQMLAVSDVVPGDVIRVELTCAKGEYSNMTVSAAVLDPKVFEEAYKTLSASTLQLTEFSNTYVAGTIECDRDGLLYTSIPQNGCWSAVVDGKPADITLVGDAMVAVELTHGAHTVAFIYNNSAFRLGAWISLAAAAIFLLLILILYRPAPHRGKYQR